MRRSIGPLLLALLLLAVPAAGAAAAVAPPKPAKPPAAAPLKLSEQPGYLPLADLGLFSSDEVSMEINLEGPLLRMVAGATRKEDPGFASVISSLQGIQVRVFPVAAAAQESFSGKIGRAARWLEGRGWLSTMRVREKDSEVYIYLKESGGQIQGLTLLAVDPTEAVVINIVGRIDPDEIGRLGQRLNMPQLQKAVPQQPQPKKSP